MRKFSTRSIHEGEKYVMDSITTPIFQTSNFLMSGDKYRAKSRSVYSYSRLSNPTIRTVEEKLASLCGGVDGVLFSSGMGAISAVLLTFLQTGDRIIFVETLYGGTVKLAKDVLSRLGIVCEFVSTEHLDKANIERAKILYVEALTNPLLKLTDVEALAEKAHSNGSLLVVDNTFLSPYNFRPLEWGADIEIHSASKYIGGHSDIIAGFVTSKDKNLVENIWEMMYTLGFNTSPFNASLLCRSIKTLSLRVRIHNENAKSLAEFLRNHRKVRSVSYPSLNDNIPECYSKCPGYGGVVYIDLGNMKDAILFAENLRVFKEATSLAGVESLVTIPVLTSHSILSDEELLKMGISKGGVRLSAGLEDVDDLLSDVDQALAKI